MTDSWQIQAKCAGVDTDLFFQEIPSVRFRKRRAEVLGEITRPYCEQCPVVTACREWALTKPEQHGVWGGMAADEREEMMGRPRRSHRSVS